MLGALWGGRFNRTQQRVLRVPVGFFPGFCQAAPPPAPPARRRRRGRGRRCGRRAASHIQQAGGGGATRNAKKTECLIFLLNKSAAAAAVAARRRAPRRLSGTILRLLRLLHAWGGSPRRSRRSGQLLGCCVLRRISVPFPFARRFLRRRRQAFHHLLLLLLPQPLSAFLLPPPSPYFVRGQLHLLRQEDDEGEGQHRSASSSLVCCCRWRERGEHRQSTASAAQPRRPPSEPISAPLRKGRAAPAPALRTWDARAQAAAATPMAPPGSRGEERRQGPVVYLTARRRALLRDPSPLLGSRPLRRKGRARSTRALRPVPAGGLSVQRAAQGRGTPAAGGAWR